MPSKLRSDNLLDELRRLRSQRTWTEPRPVYVAAGLIMGAALLMLAVVSGVKQPAMPVPTTPAARQEAPVEPVIRPESQVREPAAAETADKPGDLRNVAPRQPVAGTVRVAFGWQYYPLYGDWRYHPGVDLAAPAGSTVKALWAGRVTEVFEDKQFGLTVAVSGGGYTVYYGSLAAAEAGRNQQLAAGSVVGKVGEAPGEPFPHLHLAAKYGDKYVDPQEILAKGE
ncbi:MAG TPA: M23 family metallopeptidase [Negativicutes bacterium]|nr:M23 family metallopeptidase [Negativicutes bacterium]